MSMAAVNVLIVRPKASVSTRSLRRLACVTWFRRGVHVDCSHESRMRQIRMSGSTRGGEALPRRLLYWLNNSFRALSEHFLRFTESCGVDRNVRFDLFQLCGVTAVEPGELE